MRLLARAAAEAANVYNERPRPYTWQDNAVQDLRTYHAQLLGHSRDGTLGARARQPNGVAWLIERRFLAGADDETYGR